MMHTFPNLTLVTGGAASGKSRWAERLVQLTGRDQVYIATAQGHDDEMRAKIAAHKADRGQNWRTIEAPLDLIGVLRGKWHHEIILVDCLSMWLSNHLLAQSDLDVQADDLLACLATLQIPAVLVTNEVGASVVPDNALARRFQHQQGVLNQRVAQQADLVVAVMAGLPLALKGEIPAGMA